MTACVVAAITFIPFVAGALAGRSFFFRDLSLHFFPLRRLVVEGLWRGEVRYWNPFTNEGGPSLPIAYPIDLLQLLWPDERGFSLLLALHVPFAAMAFMTLARGLGLAPLAAGAGALVYALGGFALSSLNLYVYLQALAWAPLLVLSLLRASNGSPGRVAVAALAIALSLSTTGIEVALQALGLGILLNPSGSAARSWLRLTASTLLGVGLLAQPIFVLSDVLAGTTRGLGISSSVVLANSVHPVSLMQVVIASFHGDLGRLSERWWGPKFFSEGFPYFVSLYLGAAALSIAIVGVIHGPRWRWRLVAASAVALVVCLGPWAGLRPIVEAVPALRLLRYPSKAFFTLHFSAAVLVAVGLGALLETGRRRWATLVAAGLGLGLFLVSLRAVPHLAPGWTRSFLLGFFPPEFPWWVRLDDFQLLLRDAQLGGLPALIAGLAAVAVAVGRLEANRAAFAIVALLAADLLRTGSGLNPMVTQSFYTLSDEVVAQLPVLREGRVFTCLAWASPAFARAREARGANLEAWTVATLMDTLTPNFNVAAQVRSAYGLDVTMSAPAHTVLRPEEADCRDFARIEERLRRACARHVLSLHPLASAELQLVQVLEPARLRPLAIHLYRMSNALPLESVAGVVRSARDRRESDAIAGEPGFQERGGVVIEGSSGRFAGGIGQILESRHSTGRIELELASDAPTMAVVREAHAPGWLAWVNGISAPVLRADGRHLAVPVEAGRSRVLLRYRPPRASMGLGLTLGSFAVCLAMAFARRRKRD